MTKKSIFSTQNMVLIALSVTLIAICSWISIPITIPFTMQTFAIFTIVGILGTRRSFIAIVIYMLLGAVGVPVFSGFTGGLGRLFGTTGGYILGFLFTSLVSGFVIHLFGKKIVVMVLAMILGLITCYAFGTAWFIYLYTKTTEPIGIMTALSWCVFPYIIPDLLKIGLGVLTVKRVSKYVNVSFTYK